MKKRIISIAISILILGSYFFYQYNNEQHIIAQFNELTRLSNLADGWDEGFDKQYKLNPEEKELRRYVGGQTVILGRIRALAVDKELKIIRDEVVRGIRSATLLNANLVDRKASNSLRASLNLKTNESYAMANQLARDFMWRHGLNAKARFYRTWAHWDNSK